MALTKEEKEKRIKEFGLNAKDTGSVEVQVAMLTDNIKNLTDHLQQFPKDFSAKRGLLKLVANRRTFLKYIERIDKAKYKDIIARLGLKR